MKSRPVVYHFTSTHNVENDQLHLCPDFGVVPNSDPWVPIIGKFKVRCRGGVRIKQPSCGLNEGGDISKKKFGFVSLSDIFMLYVFFFIYCKQTGWLFTHSLRALDWFCWVSWPWCSCFCLVSAHGFIHVCLYVSCAPLSSVLTLTSS